MPRIVAVPLVLALGLAAAASPVRADEGAAPPAAPAAPAAPADTAQSELQALESAFRGAMTAWMDEQRKAAEAAEKAAAEAKARGEKPKPMPAMSMVSPVPAEFVPKFAAFARKHPDAPEAVKALVFVVSNGAAARDAAPAKEALAALLGRHVDDPGIQDVVLGLDRYGALLPDLEAAREDILQRSKNPEVKAAALYGPAMRTFGYGSQADAEEKKSGRAVLERLVKEYPGTRWGRMAAGTLNEMDHLQVGQVAPDFEGKAPDGKTIRLSDFRGKAVLLDYWGLW